MTEKEDGEFSFNERNTMAKVKVKKTMVFYVVG